jgi:hypothetical protein
LWLLLFVMAKRRRKSKHQNLTSSIFLSLSLTLQGFSRRTNGEY